MTFSGSTAVHSVSIFYRLEFSIASGVLRFGFEAARFDLYSHTDKNEDFICYEKYH